MASLGARTLGRVLGASAARAPVRPMLHRAFSVPHMADKVVSVTFSNNAGEALKVKAREGQSVYEVALQHDVQIGDLYSCHVILSPESYAAHEKPLDEEEEELIALADRRTPTSRIASFLKLSAVVPETLVAITPQRDTAQP